MIGALRTWAWKARRALQRRFIQKRVPTAGYLEQRVSAPRIEELDDASLAELNRLLPWHCFVVDAHGRRFGDVAWNAKRTSPEQIPDRRIVLLDEAIGLRGKTVLEIGCFEGVQTTALCERAKLVKAVDSRIENVVKTLVRCWGLGHAPELMVCDVERLPADTARLRCDVCHHVGVLYHLREPVAHLIALARSIDGALMLDTHVARPAELDGEYESNGRIWRYRRYGEHGRKDPFSGMYDHAKWLTEDDLVEVLRVCGFVDIEIRERRDERNGLRILVIAQKPK